VACERIFGNLRTREFEVGANSTTPENGRVTGDESARTRVVREPTASSACGHASPQREAGCGDASACFD
jgi:hypothetical protein